MLFFGMKIYHLATLFSTATRGGKPDIAETKRF
jgi:hypothetical protein